MSQQPVPSRWVRVGLPAPADAAGSTAEAVRATAADPEALLRLLDALDRAQVTIARMSSPDLAAQLRGAVGRPVDTVVCSLLDADETAPLNATVAADFSADVCMVVRWLATATKAGRVFAVTDRAQQVPRLSDVHVAAIAHAYPQLHASLLLKIVLDRRLRPGRSPVEAGVLVLDAAAALAVAGLLRALAAGGTPTTAMPAAVHDAAIRRTGYALAAPAVTWREVLPQFGAPFAGRIAEGAGAHLGPLLTARPADVGQLVGRAGEATLHVGAVSAAAVATAEPCIRIGWCHDVCPAGVKPALVLEAAQSRLPHLAESAGLGDCVYCGLCQFVCPSGLPLLEGIRAASALTRATPNPPEAGR